MLSRLILLTSFFSFPYDSKTFCHADKNDTTNVVAHARKFVPLLRSRRTENHDIMRVIFLYVLFF